MAQVNITVDSKVVSVSSGTVAHAAIMAASLPTTTNAVPRLRISLLNQIFSAGDNITIKGGEVMTTSLA